MKLENTFTVPVPRKAAWDVLLDVERIAPCMPGATLTSRDGDSFTGTVKVKVGPINLTYGGKASFVSLDEAAGVAVIEGSGKETRGTGTAKATITCRLLDKGPTTDIAVETDLAVTGKPASFGRGVLADVSAKLVDQFAACLADEIEQGSPELITAPTIGMAEDRGPTDAFSAVAAPAAAPDALSSPPDEPAGGDDAAFEPGSAGSPSPTDIGVGPSAAAAAVDEGAAAAAPAATAPTATAPTATRPRPPRKEAEPINLIDTAGLPVAKRLLPALGVLVLLAVLVRRLTR